VIANLGAKHRAAPGDRDQLQRMLPQYGSTANDGEAEAKALRAIPRRVLQLHEFLEDYCLLICGDARAGIPYLDFHRRAAPAAAEQNSATSSYERLLSRPRMMFRPKPLTPFHEDPLLYHKAKSRKQQQAQDNSFEGGFVDPSEQDDTYGRSGSQGRQRNAKVDQNL
jgi:hypothetical protein